MRFLRPPALAVALLVSPPSAPAEDIVGTVKSFDQAGRTLTLEPDGSKKATSVLLPKGVKVYGTPSGTLPMSSIAPGAQVLLREQPVIAELLIQDL